LHNAGTKFRKVDRTRRTAPPTARPAVSTGRQGSHRRLPWADL